MSVEVICKLTPGICRYEPAAGQAKAEFTRTEIAGMLAGLSSAAFCFALAKYCGDEDAFWQLVYKTRVWAAGLAANEGWEIVRGRPTVYNLSAIACFEAVYPGICRACSGVGFVKVRPCACCGGSGHKAMPMARVAEACGLPYTSYLRHWQPRYLRLLGLVVDLDGEVNKCIASLVRKL